MLDLQFRCVFKFKERIETYCDDDDDNDNNDDNDNDINVDVVDYDNDNHGWMGTKHQYNVRSRLRIHILCNYHDTHLLRSRKQDGGRSNKT